MHTRTYGDFTFTSNGDYSGTVEISDLRCDESFEVPGAVLLAFAADLIRQRRIAVLEQMSIDELLR